MSHAAFLDAIRAEPHDDTHRLVYADWLDDHGASEANQDLAEFIRVQCRLAHLDRFAPERDDLELRERELLARHERTWLGDVPGLSSMTFRRGFLSDVMLPVGVFLPGWERLFAQHPITAVMFEAEEESFPAGGLAECPALERLTSLNLSHSELPELDPGVHALLRSPRLGNLRRLNVATCGLCYVGGGDLASNAALANLRELNFSGGSLDESDSENALGCFTDSEVLTALTHLNLWGSRNVPSVLLGLNTAPFHRCLEWLNLQGSTRYDYDDVVGSLRLSRLRSLALSRETLEAGGAAALLDSPHLPALTDLDLSGSKFRRGWEPRLPDDALLSSLLATGGWSRLESLTLSYGAVTAAGVRDLARTPTHLHTLDLSNNPLGPEGVRALADLPWLAGVCSLSLANTAADDDALADLMRSPALANLRVLLLRENSTLSARGLDALARSPHLSRLRELSLARTSLADAAPESLENLPRLAWLDLSESHLGAGFVARLARCPWLARLGEIDFYRNPDLGGDALRPLAESPYLSPACHVSCQGVPLDAATSAALRERLGWRFHTGHLPA